MSTLIFGHKSPDTDAITSAITFAKYEKLSGNTDVEAVALGKPNDETQYALDFFKVEAPRVITAAAPETDTVELVDHNEAQQSVDDRDQVTIAKVIDHHRVANFATAAPLYMNIQPIGSCNSIIYQMYQQEGFEITPTLAGLMASGLISDTLLLKSPTTTELDKKIFAELQDIAGIDLSEYGLNMLKAGTNLAARTDKELIDGDAKTFDMNGTKVRVAQVNTVDLSEIYDRQEALESAMQAEVDADGYGLFLTVATDILNSNSVAIALGATDKVEAAFGKKFDANKRMDLPGVVSRKKQVVPPLTEAFN
jgi:manganese-dependent inorganic pyrophosphatase